MYGYGYVPPAEFAQIVLDVQSEVNCAFETLDNERFYIASRIRFCHFMAFKNNIKQLCHDAWTCLLYTSHIMLPQTTRFGFNNLS